MWKVLRSGTLHVVSQQASDSGGRVAMTVLEQQGIGAIVWAGILLPHALHKPAEFIEMHDYAERQTTSFSSWSMLWPYYESQASFAPLVPELRALVDARMAALDLSLQR